VVEAVFALPGIGQTLLNAINARDDPLVEGIAALSGLFVVAVNLIIDLLYRIVDPRTRRA
jgi:peptide/nickel transport system permease protein